MIYEWRCQVCGECTEVERHVDDYQLGPSENEAACTCGCENYTRKIGVSAVPFETLRDQGVFERTHWKRGT